jgi:hypothetical protein
MAGEDTCHDRVAAARDTVAHCDGEGGADGDRVVLGITIGNEMFGPSELGNRDDQTAGVYSLLISLFGTK